MYLYTYFLTLFCVLMLCDFELGLHVIVFMICAQFLIVVVSCLCHELNEVLNQIKFYCH
jgi:hypothetical protein